MLFADISYYPDLGLGDFGQQLYLSSPIRTHLDDDYQGFVRRKIFQIAGQPSGYSDLGIQMSRCRDCIERFQYICQQYFRRGFADATGNADDDHSGMGSADGDSPVYDAFFQKNVDRFQHYPGDSDEEGREKRQN